MNSKSTKNIHYCPSLDGLRAVCIIFTLLNHTHGAPSFINGSIGVDIFFALSGFLITGILMNVAKTDLRSYYIRRFFRIAPVYYLGLSITAGLAISLALLTTDTSKLEQLREIILPSIFFSRELSNAPTLFGQAWTICIEEKFYLFCPILLLAIRDTRSRCALLIGLVVGLGFLGSDTALRGYGGIALGAICSILYFRLDWSINIWLAGILLCLAYIACLIIDFWWRNILISAASAPFVVSLYARESFFSSFLSHRWLVYLGKLTFSIYIFHVIVFSLISAILHKLNIFQWYFVFPIGYFAVVVWAAIIYKYFEFPLIRFGRLLTERPLKRV